MPDENPSTDTIEAVSRKPRNYNHALCQFDYCPANEKLDRNEAKLLIKRELTEWDKNHETKSGIWVKLGIVILPFVVGFFVWLSNINSRVAILEHQSIINNEVRNDIRTIKTEISTIRERLIVLEQRENR